DRDRRAAGPAADVTRRAPFFELLQYAGQRRYPGLDEVVLVPRGGEALDRLVHVRQVAILRDAAARLERLRHLRRDRDGGNDHLQDPAGKERELLVGERQRVLGRQEVGVAVAVVLDVLSGRHRGKPLAQV